MATVVEEGASPVTKTRTSAKETVSSKWATRAQQSNRKQQANEKQQPVKPSLTVTQPAPPNLICHTWRKVQSAIGNQLLKHLAKQQFQPGHTPVVRKRKKKVDEQSQKRIGNRQNLADTITNRHLSAALQSQLAEITQGESKYLKSVLSILPAGYDEDSALISSIQTRKRAFMLLDLGRVIKSHAQFIALTCGFGDFQQMSYLSPTHRLKRFDQQVNNVSRKKKGVYIQPQFKVMKNPSLELLKLLTRLGIDLRCTSCDDVGIARMAIEDERQEREVDSSEDELEVADYDVNNYFSLVDDVSKSRKPDGYFRRLLRAQNFDCTQLQVAVDCVEEVHRISTTLRRLSKRHNGEESTQQGCKFVLRLPAGYDSMNKGEWEKLVVAVHQAALEENGALVGVSVDFSVWSQYYETDGTLNQDQEEKAQQILMDICAHLRLSRLLLLSVGQYHVRIDLTGLPNPFNRQNCGLLTNALKNIVCSDVQLRELEELQVGSDDAGSLDLQVIVDRANDPSTSSLRFTADVSDQLVKKSGALCCRLIGVKDGKVPAEGDAPDKKAVAKHFYIDDGCYGSLGSTKCGSDPSTCTMIQTDSCHSNDSGQEQFSSSTRQHLPIPLYGGKLAPKSKLVLQNSVAPSRNTSTSLNEESQTELVLSTVWGPTCDGLDKVCDKVLLPSDLKANRDWIVFSNLGCGGFGGGLGLGTAFNGFDPPDIAYCVLQTT